MEIFFNQKLHKYTDENGFVYQSVTSLIEKFKNKFDAKFWLKAKGIELFYKENYGEELWYNILEDYKKEHKQNAWKVLVQDVEKEVQLPDLSPYMKKVSKEWKKKNDDSIITGNIKHDFFEKSINESLRIGFVAKPNISRAVTIRDILDGDYRNTANNIAYFKSWKNQYPRIYRTFCNYIERNFRIYSEIVAFSHLYKVCGTIDVPVLNFIDKTFYIDDWKTNEKELKDQAGYYKKENGVVTDRWIRTYETMKYPLNNLEQCDISTYTLQLSLYAFMVESITGFRCLGLTINHINSEGEKRIQVPYLKKEAKLMLDHKDDEDDTIFVI